MAVKSVTGKPALWNRRPEVCGEVCHCQIMAPRGQYQRGWSILAEQTLLLQAFQGGRIGDEFVLKYFILPRTGEGSERT